MNIIVCPLSQVRQMVATHAPERVVSLLDPDLSFPDLGSGYIDLHLKLQLHDVHQPSPGQIAPALVHVTQLLDFVAGWRRSLPLLIHCRAGIGRSTATAFIAACLHNPDVSERAIADQLRHLSPLARPNQVLVDLADAAMGRNGRMSEAIEETGRELQWHGVDENMPFQLPGTFVVT
jgi:predicted protein tyrosine phosphatase